MSVFFTQATVQCTDGRGGVLTDVLVDRVSRKVTQLVVRTGSFEASARLVPIDRVAETSHDTIRLNCTIGELELMPLFYEAHYAREDMGPETAYMYYSPYSSIPPVDIPIMESNIPAGQLAIHPGMRVDASDGRVGSLAELVIDSASGAITHFVLRGGPRFNRQEQLVPLAAVERVDDDETVRLKLTKKQIAALPSVAVRRHYDWTPDAATVIELLVEMFPHRQTAGEALSTLKKAAKEHSVDLLNAAALVKDADGGFTARESHDMGARGGALIGAVAGGLLSLLVGPVGLLAGAAAGALTGGGAAALVDMGFPKSFLESIQQTMQPDSSALVVLVEQSGIDTVLKALDQFDGTPVRQTLTPAMVGQLGAADKHAPADGD
jgi:uncharacterized membrane protein